MKKDSVTTEISCMESKIPTSLLYMALGISGGVVKVFSSYLGEEEHPTAGKFLIILAMNMVISGFCGYMGSVFASVVNDNQQFHIICAGIFGYLGTNGLDYMVARLKEKNIL